MRQAFVLIDLRGVLGGLVTSLLRDAYGDTAVDEVPAGMPLTVAVTTHRPRILITSLAPGADPATLPPAVGRLLHDHPHLRVLIVESDGREGSIWELRPHRSALGELSRSGLVQAIGEVPPGA
ncbi:hypothetical protein AB0M02_32920 [Actinoplanes sp. NPDC051861]|uniref:hypothetical protein n=1 Tax=Actinoplanes sp. NPDC051861 TaxID=3155170 RepID=UPI003434C183